MARAETVVVGPADGTCPSAIFTRIQSAIDAALPGSTISICPGVYAEQLLVTKPVRLIASPGARLAPSHVTPGTTSARTGRPVAAALILRAPATVDGLAIDLSAHGVARCDGTEPLLAGIYVRGVNASVLGSSVTGTRIAGAPSTCANGVGILVQGGGGAPRVRVEGNTIDTYQRAGIVVEDPDVRGVVRENLVTGDGEAAAHVQDGIEIANGASALVRDNVVRGNAGAGSTACEMSAGIRLDAPRIRVRGNLLAFNAVGIAAGSRGHQLRDNAIEGGTVGVVGLELDADESRVIATRVTTHTVAGVRIAGNRTRLRDNVVETVHGAPRCDAVLATPGCATAFGRCGVGIWIVGRANQLLGTIVADADQPILDDGRGNVVRSAGR